MQKSYMKRYFYFVREPQAFNRDSVILHVKVGHSDRECAQLALLQHYCKDAGWYFQPVSAQSDTAIDFLCESVCHGKKLPRMHVRSSLVTVSELYDMIIDGTLEAYESAVPVKKAQLYTLNIIDPAFRFANVKSNQSNNCQPLQRKNLSNGTDSQGSFVAIAFALVIALFLLAGHLEYIETCF